MRVKGIGLLVGEFAVFSCETLSYTYEYQEVEDCTLPDVAQMIAALPIQSEQLQEVYAAVSTSTANGYDEEYMLRDLFVNPGAGVGQDEDTKAGSYSRPMKDLIREYLSEKYVTKAGEPDYSQIDTYIDQLASSGAQIYWPYSENWNGKSLPILTYDPGNNSETNTGYEIVINADGSRSVEELIVDEEVAMSRPVWVINNNDDSSFKSLEMRRKEDPDWGRGGTVLVKSGDSEADDDDVHTLILKDFMMTRNLDSWFGGGSEFFIKCGGVNGFKATTEDEMRNYQPTVTDFMIVVRRSQKGKPVPFNAIVVSDWTDQMENYAFLITEDDGGTTTSWKCNATVKVKSKSYGIEIEIPYKDKDDIVWRGSLARKYLEKYNGQTEHFGDVDLVFQVR